MDDAMVDAARDAAYNSIHGMQPARSTKLVGDKSVPSLESVKDSLRQAIRPRMRKCEYFLCDRCDMPIIKPEDGFIVHGNVYVADPSCRGGLIGNNFPQVEPGDKIEVTDVKESVFCKECFIAATVGIVEKERDRPPKLYPVRKEAPKPAKRPARPEYSAQRRNTIPAPSEEPQESIDDEDFLNELRNIN